MTSTTDSFILPARLKAAKALALAAREAAARTEAERIAGIRTLERLECAMIRDAIARDVDPDLADWTRLPSYFQHLPVPVDTSAYVHICLPGHAPIHVRFERRDSDYAIIERSSNPNYSARYSVGPWHSEIYERTWTNDLGEALLLAEERPGLAIDPGDDPDD